MKITRTLTLLSILLSLNSFGQNTPTEEAQPIVAEGKLLYRSEMASWYGTDIFMQLYKDRDNIGGYFSYTIKDMARCIFYSKADPPKVIGSITFDSTYSLPDAKTDLSERNFTDQEQNLYEIRRRSMQSLQMNEDNFFSFYDNTSPNLIPLIDDKERKVYILTGPRKNGVIIFGNDYLLRFDKHNQLVSKKRLHQNLLPFEYQTTEEDKETEGGVHSHLPETGKFITATDICTLMLYSKMANWKTHTVVSKEYLNIWNCRTNTLLVLPRKTVEKINKDITEKEKKQ